MKLGRGKAWVFDGVLDVDWQMIAGDGAEKARAKVGKSATHEEYAKAFANYLMTPVDAEFPKKVKPGDYIVGGKGIGYGHDHNGPSVAMQGAGIKALLCEATNANFKRNTICYGIAVVEVPGILAVTKTGDELEVDLSAGIVKNLTSNKELRFIPFPDFLTEIIQAGGYVPLLKSMVAAGKF